MKGFFRFGRRGEAAPPKVSTAEEAAREHEAGGSGEPHRSLALPVLLAGLRQRPKPRILDLGSAQAANLDFLAPLQGRITIEDLPATLAVNAAPAAKLVESLLAEAPPASFDAVLAWDLFDYLDTAGLSVLAARLAALCAPGALLFALVAYRAEMPERPHRFRFVDAETLHYQTLSSRLRPAPRRNARDLGNLLPDFTVEGTYLLRNGYHEYVFVKRGEVSAPAGTKHGGRS